VAVALETQPVADVTPATTYVVVRGDTLSTIAHRHHLTMAELRAANGLKSGSTLQVGQKLVLPSKPGASLTGASGAAAAPTAPGATTSALAGAPGADKPRDPAAPKVPVDGVKHVVKAGETLGSIARHYNVKLGDIATANNISDPKRIRPGQELIIPGKSAAKAPKAAKGKPATASAATAEAPPPEVAPAPGQDLDSGLKPAAPAEVPIVKVEDGSATPPKNP
jgi:LysM repeat protein